MLKTKRIVSLLLFSFVFIIYAISCSNTITFWDSPEFIASNFNLLATHPPGAPFYTMFCSAILSIVPISKVALASNLISSFFGAITVTILFKITFYITENIQDKFPVIEQNYLPYITGITSALTLAFSTSFWIASTETEVYTLSFALMSAMVYVAFKWEGTKNKGKEHQLFLLFSLLLGISTGVHLITISVLIPLTILFTHKIFGLNLIKIALSLIGGCILFFSVYLIGVQGIIKLASNIDIWLVNSYRFPVNTGSLVVLILIVIVFISILWLSYKKQQPILYKLTLGLLFFYIGFSSYFMPMQRTNANTLIANGTQTNNRLLQYVKGSQFGIEKIPLFYGHSYNAPLDKDVPFIDGKPDITYDNETKQYIIVNDGKLKEVNYAKEFSMVFPRVFDLNNTKRYQSWTTIKGETLEYPVMGELQKFKKPTFNENFSFFINYQVLWLNTRYLFWNFIGKQNNDQGIGHIKSGNWISGINFIDKSRVGDYAIMPKHYRNEKSRNTYYFLPFILGLLGIYSLRKQTHYLLTTLLLFLAFGIGITLYINPLPSSILVRERDYIFIGSFVFFALWVGLSVIVLFRLFKFIPSNKIKIVLVSSLVFIISPLQLLAKGWNDHQRSHDNFAYNFGKAYLDACPEQAILITNGDNMTFPLWYLQEVEKYRTDVRVLNFDQLNLDQQIKNLKQKANASNPIKLSLNKKLYINGAEKLFPLQKEIDAPIKLPLFFEFLKDSTTQINWNGKLRHYVPSTKFTLAVDTLKFKKHNQKYLNQLFKGSYTSSLTWNYPKKFYGLNELVVLNIITNNIYDRPICFTINGKTNHYVGLQKYMIQSGMIEQLAPIKRKNPLLNPKIVNTQMMYPYVMNRLNFEYLNDDSLFHSYENKSYAQNILRRNYYFLAQALLEENKPKDAITVLDKCFSQFPDKTIPYKQFAYALGKLYYKAGKTKKGEKICKIAMNNIWDELNWSISFNPPNSIINVQHTTKLKNMHSQMRQQFPGDLNNLNINEKTLNKFETDFKLWQQKNWPY